ncbi:MAG TPA: DUF72 domain-containing protein [Anaeromyxobacteraceae bacterium]|nr:DUF72 domain-containing protein [Anaeromyxobacteraceae bacterium]
MRVLSGTSGFSFPEWKGAFYPAGLPEARWLGFYAGQLPAVEVNNTFYRMPSEKLLAGWRDQVPASFRFALKAPQRVTHRLRLKEAADPVAHFHRVAGELGERLGPALYQLPPNLKKDLPRLSDFLAVLPAGVRAAFEFRHPSWFSDDVFQALQGRNAALCVAESEDLEVPLVATADFGYLRLRHEAYGAGELTAWCERILDQPWGEAFVFFKHEDPEKGPRFAAALVALAGSRP